MLEVETRVKTRAILKLQSFDRMGWKEEYSNNDEERG